MRVPSSAFRIEFYYGIDKMLMRLGSRGDTSLNNLTYRWNRWVGSVTIAPSCFKDPVNFYIIITRYNNLAMGEAL